MQKNSDGFNSNDSDAQNGASPIKTEKGQDRSESNIPSEDKKMVKPSFMERWKTHRFLIVRGVYYVFYSIWMTVVVIGGFIAWLISLLFI